jgi:RimJ/RimL family protein N-acetyltransferase
MISTGIPGPAYRVRTRRLVLRCWEPADAEALNAAIDASLEHLRPWMPWANDEPADLQARIERLRS